MSRLITWGAEVQILGTSDLNTPEGDAQRYVGAPTFSATKHGDVGEASMACDASGEYSRWEVTIELDVDYYARWYMRISGNPTNQLAILTFPSGSKFTLRLETTGALRLYNSAAVALGVGSSSLSADTWYKVAVHWRLQAAGAILELQLDDVSIDSLNPSLPYTTAANLALGIVTGTPGITAYFDDFALNNGAGAAPFNTWPESGYVALLRPVADSAVGSGWQAPQTTGSDTTDIYTAVDNAVPAGVAHSDIDANNLAYVFNDSATVPSSYDVEIEDYETAGIPSGSSIRVVQALGRVGTSSRTGTNTGELMLVSNPADAAATSIDFENVLASTGTEPAGWYTYRAEQHLDPTITRDTRPVVRVTKTTSTTRAHMVDLLGVLVEYTEATGADGASAGVATVAGVGAALFTGVGASAGVATVAGVGAALFSGVGSSSGVGAGSGVSGALAGSVGATAGAAATVSGVGAANFTGVGASAGVATVSGVGHYSADTITFSGVSDPTIKLRGLTSPSLALSSEITIRAGRATRFELVTDDTLDISTGHAIDLKIGIPTPLGQDTPTIVIDEAMTIADASNASVLVLDTDTALLTQAERYRYAVVLSNLNRAAVHGRVKVTS